MGGRDSTSAFTTLEFVIVVALIATLAAVVLPKFHHLSLRAEAVGVQGTIGTLRSALSMKIGRALAQGQNFTAWLPGGEQALYPMRDLLAEYADTYLGVLSASQKRGHWFDDRESHELVYVVRNDEIVSGIAAEPRQLRWRLVGVHQETSDPTSPVIAVKLQPVTTFKWTIP